MNADHHALYIHYRSRLNSPQNNCPYTDGLLHLPAQAYESEMRCYLLIPTKADSVFRAQCDERKPTCDACARRGIRCEGYMTRFVFRDDTDLVGQRVEKIEQAKWSVIREGSSHTRQPRQKRTTPITFLSPETRSHFPSPVDLPTLGTQPVLEISPKDGIGAQENTEIDQDPGRTSNDGLGQNENCGMDVLDHTGAPKPHLSDRDCHTTTFPPYVEHVRSHSVHSSRQGLSQGYFQDNAAIEAEFQIGIDDDVNDVETVDQAVYDVTASDFFDHQSTVDSGSRSLAPSVRLNSLHPSSSEASEKPKHDSSLAVPNLAHRDPLCGEISTISHWGSLGASESLYTTGTENLSILSEYPSSATERFNHELENSKRQKEFMNYWRHAMASQLPPVLHDISSLISKYAVVKLAVLALSSARMNESLKSGLDKPGYLSPHNESLAYYSQALREFSALDWHRLEGVQLCAMLVVLQLLAYVEIEIGTYYGSLCHTQKLDQMIRENQDRIQRSVMGIQLLIAWAGLRAFHAVDCSLYTVNTFALTFAGTELQCCVDRYIELTSAAYPFTALRLAATCRASNLLLTLRSVGKDSSNPLYRKWASLIRKIGCGDISSNIGSLYPPKELYKILEEEQHLLDNWEDKLQLKDRPLESFKSSDFCKQNTSIPGLRVRPLQFPCHHAALNYLRYACAQLYASRDNLDLCIEAAPTRSAEEEIDPWVLLNLRILAGLDVEKCLRESCYEIGAIWIALKVALRCCSLRAMLWVQAWTAKFDDYPEGKVGSLPVSIAKRVLTKLVDELDAGRYVYLMITNLNEFVEKQDLQSSRIPELKAAILGCYVQNPYDNNHTRIGQTRSSQWYVDLVERF